jgi:hypothetical protein
MVKPELHSGGYQGIAGSFEKDDVSTGRHIGSLSCQQNPGDHGTILINFCQLQMQVEMLVQGVFIAHPRELVALGRCRLCWG